MLKNKKCFQFKVILVASKPLIWREFIVLSDYSFFALHVAIQDSFGWEDCHLHQFLLKDPFKKQKSIAWPSPNSKDVIDERQALLKDYIEKVGDTIFYEYDFGDGWIHKIELKKIIHGDQIKKIPQLVNGANACPPENCGGINGYYDLINSIKNFNGEAHEDMMMWMGLDDSDDFDPTYFDKDEVTFSNFDKILKEYSENF